MKRLLLRESQAQPLLVVFEDLHWIDSETQALLDGLVESLPAARLLLLVNYRPEYQHPWGSRTYYTQLRLDPLPAGDRRASSSARCSGPTPASSPLKRMLIARTEGNPFFLEESVRTLVETGALAGERGAYRLARPLPAIQVPATVQAVLAARIDRLPPEDKAPPADRLRRRQGRAVGTAPGDRRAAGRGTPPRTRPPAGRRVPLRDEPLSRPRVHLQARAHARSGLRRACSTIAVGTFMRGSWTPSRPGIPTACRARRAPRLPCVAGRALGQGVRISPASGHAGRRAIGAPEPRSTGWSRRWPRSNTCQRPGIPSPAGSTSGSTCTRRFSR